uniref:DMAP-interaction domain-containing protein n=1 Tax=Syphacia muris TaxID=451379 RepID=A0A0N5ARI5_9BILA
MGDIDINRLPLEVREHLAQLDLELSEGDITQKGYDKKRNILLAPYLKGQTNGTKVVASPSTKAYRRHQRRLTRDESRYHSGKEFISLKLALIVFCKIRAEAVQQALAECSKAKKERPKILQPIKRRGGNSFCERKNRTSDSSSDDESTLGSTGRSKQSGSIRSKDSREKLRKTRPSGSNSDFTKLLQPDVTSNAVTAGDTARVKKSVKNGHRNVHSEEVCALESTSGLGAEIIAPTTTCALNDSDLKDNVVYANTVNNYANQDGDQEYQNAIIRKEERFSGKWLAKRQMLDAV